MIENGTLDVPYLFAIHTQSYCPTLKGYTTKN